MKKLLLSAAALMAFSIAISIFQMSCTKIANSQTPSYTLQPATTTKLGGVIPDGTTISVDATGKISAPNSYTLQAATTTKLGGVIPDGTTISVDATGKISANAATQVGKLLYGVTGATEPANAIWTSNFDGSNPQKINITMPTGIVIAPDNIRISPDHKTIFFSAHTIPPASILYYLYSCNIDGSNLRQIRSQGANGVSVEVAY
ncbi:hypothetical protein [Mucilaginibacter endophyticus]|uniref:hypothetical protein n=1 Tax=Mucilaginibacter endophyticus TaxID=2675003 RepID=UPI000E0D1A48|nr:hypothetical protein [Mucilaginibacter endophyticus]